MTVPASNAILRAADEPQIEDVHRLCVETRQQIELVYQLLYFIGERLAANPDEFYRFVQELKAYVQSNTS
jgi:hypothetical protein